MIVYLETSALLRRLLKQPKPISHWEGWTKAYTSEITRAEALRIIEGLRRRGKMTDAEVAESVQGLDRILRKLSVIHLNSFILNRAGQAFPTVIGTLDAIHLSSALLCQEHQQKELTFLTHDPQIGRAAHALGLKALGFH